MHGLPAQRVDHLLPDSMTTDDVTTLPELLRWRRRRSPEREAYRQCEAGVWRSYSWREVEGLVARLQAVPADERLQQHIENLCRRSLARFPEYAQVRRCWVTLEPWTIDNGLLTPTLKLKRPAIEHRFAEHILKLYVVHLSPV